jgi:hypothetical protein
LVLAALPDAARLFLEELMHTTKYKYRSDFARTYYGQGHDEGKAEGKAEGRAEGRAEGVLTMLELRGVDVPDEARQEIIDCVDLDLLEHWLRRAFEVSSTDELFD